jgi:hypothetical protein
MTDEDIQGVAQFRSMGRIPAGVWRHPRTGAVIARCAQPLVGLNSKRSAFDEKLLRCIAETGYGQSVSCGIFTLLRNL